ncbi:MAG TPA: hypothetical protein VHB02_12730 [Acidimicrobiales bacterium]|nr:hypothetical protein [Acidimicrobiales bacterium]
MLISYVLRLHSDALAEGRFVGEIEAVVSEERGPFVTIAQMTDFIMDTMPLQVIETGTARQMEEGRGEEEQ